MNYARFDFFEPVRFLADVDDSFDADVSSAQQPEGLLAAGLSFRIRALRAGVEFILAQNLTIRLYPRDDPSTVEALRCDLVLCSRVLVDPRQINPAVRIEYVRCNARLRSACQLCKHLQVRRGVVAEFVAVSDTLQCPFLWYEAQVGWRILHDG